MNETVPQRAEDATAPQPPQQTLTQGDLDTGRRHNHLTRDIKDRGVCVACDHYWEKSEEANDD